MSVLRQELKEARELQDCLRMLQRQADENSLLDSRLIVRQLNIVADLIERTRQRISLVESMSESFYDLKAETETLLQEARDAVNRIDYL